MKYDLSKNMSSEVGKQMRLGKSEGADRINTWRIKRNTSQSLLKGFVKPEDMHSLTSEDKRKLRRQLNPHVELESCSVCGLPLHHHDRDCEE